LSFPFEELEQPLHREYVKGLSPAEDAALRELASVASPGSVVLYEVDGLPDLVAFGRLLAEVSSDDKTVRVYRYCEGGGRCVDYAFIAVTGYPAEFNIYKAFLAARDAGVYPVVVYLPTDMVPGEQLVGSADGKNLYRVAFDSLFRGEGALVLFTVNSQVAYESLPVAKLASLVRARPQPGLVEERGVGGLLRSAAAAPALYPLYREERLSDLLISPSLRAMIEVNLLGPLKRDLYSVPSVLLVGPIGSGKTTLAAALANELGIPSYSLMTGMLFSKYVGETERNMNLAVMAVNNVAPAVLVFEDIENLVGVSKEQGGAEGAGGTEMIGKRSLSVALSWVKSEKRRFIAVFTVSDPTKIPSDLLLDPALGGTKLPVLPPLTVEERKALLSRFISRQASRYGLRFDPLDPVASEGLETVARTTWGYTQRELYEIASMAVNLALAKGSHAITKEHIQHARAFKEIDLFLRIELLKNTIKSLKEMGIPRALMETIYRFESEAAKYLAEAHAEEAKRRSLAVRSG